MKMPYDFASWTWILNGVTLGGFAKGDDVVTVKRRTDSFSDEVGADGRMTVFRSRDRSGEVTFKFAADSASNTYLGTLCELQEGGPATFVPIRFYAKDQALQDVAIGTVGYIKKPADFGRGEKPSDMEWTLVIERTDHTYGGASIFDL
jgi:hypothetical protein